MCLHTTHTRRVGKSRILRKTVEIDDIISAKIKEISRLSEDLEGERENLISCNSEKKRCKKKLDILNE